MKEEEITKFVIKNLKENDWRILSFDFPQSGTGIILKHNGHLNEKNKLTINPDVLAFRQGVLLYMENKESFSAHDIEKIARVKNNEYTVSLRRIFPSIKYEKILTGVALSDDDSNLSNLLEKGKDLDFFILVEDGPKFSIRSRNLAIAFSVCVPKTFPPTIQKIDKLD